MEKRHWNHGFAGAHDFPKFVKGGCRDGARTSESGYQGHPLQDASLWHSEAEMKGRLRGMATSGWELPRETWLDLSPISGKASARQAVNGDTRDFIPCGAGCAGAGYFSQHQA